MKRRRVSERVGWYTNGSPELDFRQQIHRLVRRTFDEDERWEIIEAADRYLDWVAAFPER